MPTPTPSVGRIVLYRKNNQTCPAIITATRAQSPGTKLSTPEHVNLGVFGLQDYEVAHDVARGSEYQDGTYFWPVIG